MAPANTSAKTSSATADDISPRPANAERGEITITFDGAEYTLRPTYEAILEVETQTGKTIFELGGLADGNRLPLAQAAIILAEFIKAWGRETGDRAMANVGAKRLGEMALDTGLPNVMAVLALVLYLAATGGYTPTGELKATETKTTSDPSSAA